MEELLNLLEENPEVLKVLIKSQVDKYKPLVYMIGEELLNIYKDYADNTEYFETLAKVRRSQYVAYFNAGFTEEQAMALLFNDITNMKKAISNVTSSVGNKSKKDK